MNSERITKESFATWPGRLQSPVKGHIFCGSAGCVRFHGVQPQTSVGSLVPINGPAITFHERRLESLADASTNCQSRLLALHGKNRREGVLRRKPLWPLKGEPALEFAKARVFPP